MKKSNWKISLREIARTWNRFLAIVVIVALGVAFYTGLKAVGPDMSHTATRYFVDAKMMDYKLVSNVGFTDEDKEALSAVKGIDEVNTVYAFDAVMLDDNDSRVVRVMSMPDEDDINTLQVVEGRLPKSKYECVIDGTKRNENIGIGMKISLSSGTNEDISETLSESVYTVTGKVEIPNYLNRERGTSSIGNGKVTGLVYVSRQNFTMDIYTEIFATISGSRDVPAFSTAYEEIAQPVDDELENLAEEREILRHREIIDEANDTLAEKQQELDDTRIDADQQLADAQAKIDDADEKVNNAVDDLKDARSEADKKFDEAEAKLEKSQAELDQGWHDYDQALEEYESQAVAAETGFAQAQQQIDAAYAAIDLQVSAVQTMQSQMAAGTAGGSLSTAEIEALVLEIIQGEEAVTQAEDDILALEDILAQAQGEINDLTGWIVGQETAIQALQDELDQGIANGTLTTEEIEQLEQQIASAEAALTEAETEVQALEDTLTLTRAEIDALNNWIAAQGPDIQDLWNTLTSGTTGSMLTATEIVDLQAQIFEAEAVIAAATAQVEEMEAELAAQRQVLADAEAQLDDAKSELLAAKAKLEEGRAELEDAEADAERQFADAEIEIEDKQQELADAKAELTETRLDTEQQIEEAQAQLDDAKQDIADIPEVNWVILGRDENPGYKDFNAAISRTDGLASIFPMFFFLIAALVCLTTMTRMVDEQRTQIGTMKALGYGRSAIAFKYLFYAGSASLIGSALGLTLGFLFIPRVIMMAYDKLYFLPDLMVTFSATDAVIAVSLAMGSTVAAATVTSWRELSGVPASLMRPQAPQAGKRVILERIGFIWRRLSFSYKVTVRNLLRYQKRFWMTVLGVASCSALLLTGLGLKDSVATQVSDRQFGEIFLYSMSFQVKDDLDSEQLDMIDTVVTSFEAAQTALKSETVTATFDDTSESVSMMVPMKPEDFPAYIKLRNPDTSEAFELPEYGVVVTEKLAEILGVEPGDSLMIMDSDNNEVNVTVAAIAENYLSHIITMSPVQYRLAFDEDALPNQRMLNLSADMYPDKEQALATQLTALDGVAGIRFQQDNIDEFHDVIKSLDYIVWVIILAAAALAFAVLYTLTSINISERFREIATIKVLGFYDKETSGYIFRESYILTVIGIGIGMALGVMLHGIVLDSLEVDAVMFVRQILPLSYCITAVVTLAFTWTVNKLAMGKIAKIDMVEALKGVE